MSLSTNRSLDRRDIRLPGSGAEVDASPDSPKVGAFFDLVGTLVAGFTGVIMTQDRMRRREIGVGEFLGVVQAALNHQLGRADFEQLIYRGGSMMGGAWARSTEWKTDHDGVLPGGVLKPIIWGPGKANAVQKFAADNDVDLRKSYFYADGDEDVAPMYLVGSPRPTHPAGT